ncbi:hypothetical protein VZT92_011757 [Zoarces viviparus]
MRGPHGNMAEAWKLHGYRHEVDVFYTCIRLAYIVRRGLDGSESSLLLTAADIVCPATTAHRPHPSHNSVFTELAAELIRGTAGRAPAWIPAQAMSFTPQLGPQRHPTATVSPGGRWRNNKPRSEKPDFQPSRS